VLMDASRGAVRSTLQAENSRSEGKTLARPGAPRIYDDRAVRRILRNLRTYPKQTFAQRREDTGINMSNTKIKNIARANRLHHWRAKLRPELLPKHAAERLLWCRVQKHWTLKEWIQYIWSDECSVERGKGKEIEWVWGVPKDKWKPEMVTTYKANKDIRVMVWAAFWGNGKRCPLFILERDWEAKKHGYSANSYLEVLEHRLSEFYQDGLIFMQDNAPIHTAKKVKEWMRLHEIRTTDWPPYSPDLNPIEHAWKALKVQVAKMFPELMLATGKGENDLKNLEEALVKAWDALPDSLFLSLVESMPSRIEACIEAKGWHTKY